MTSIYEQLGVPTLINAKGTATRLSGGLMAPDVAAAMVDATQYCVDMSALQGRASELIAQLTGAEAGCVTSGAAAGLLLGTAACVARLNPAAMNRLPDTRGLRREVVVVRSQRNFYDHAVRSAGVRLVEVGLADRYSGAGVRDAEPWEIADAIGEHTACVFYIAHPHSQPSLASVVEVAHAAGVPVLVDAAAQLPPRDNLRRFIAEGADLVAFSGGKAIFGPQASGLLCGRRELVASAVLQSLDHDLHFEQWSPPASLFAELPIAALPQHGIGRPCKVGKEQVVALLVALRSFVDEDIEARHARLGAMLQAIVDGLLPAVARRVHMRRDANSGEPELMLDLGGAVPAGAALELLLELQNSDPAIHADPARVKEGVIVFRASCLREEQPAMIAERLNSVVRAR